MRIFILIVLMLSFNFTSYATCYTVYDKLDKVVYKSSEPPFDLSIQISEGIKSKYPGGYLITGQSPACYLPKKGDISIESINAEVRIRNSDPRSRNISEVKNERISLLNGTSRSGNQTNQADLSGNRSWGQDNQETGHSSHRQEALDVKNSIYSSSDGGGYENPANREQIKWQVRASGEGSGCVGYAGPGGPCSYGPGGGLSYGPGGGLSSGPGGGLSYGPGGGLSSGPGGGLSYGPGGGLSSGPGNNWRRVPLD